MRRSPSLAVIAAALVLVGCARDAERCADCDALVIAAVREPPAIFPPLVLESVGRDIGDRVWERLADLTPGGATIDPGAFRPALAARWERRDSLTWRFTLRPGARWQDGAPVTADDVVFSFAAPAAVTLRFPRAYPEQLYDATQHVRILPKHLWATVPAAQWGQDTTLARYVGSGPYRLRGWRRGTSLELVADSARATPPGIRRLVWRFATDPDAALNLVLSGEADVMEHAGGPAQAARARNDTTLRLVTYPSAVVGFVSFRVADEQGRAHPVLADRRVRGALVQAVDRGAVARNVFGPATQVPVGPVSSLAWVRDDGMRTALPFDTLAADRALDSAGFVRGPAGLRARGRTALALDILVPGTSPARKQAAEALQAAWAARGVRATVTAVDFPVFRERLATGRFDAAVDAYLDEPSPRGLAEQWTRRGFGTLNAGRFDEPAVGALLDSALAATDLATARHRWHAALAALDSAAPALFLYTPAQVAVVRRRVEGFAIDPFDWLRGVTQWRVDRRAARGAAGAR